MTIERYRNDNPRTASEIASAIETELLSINSSAGTSLGTQNYAFIQSFAETLSSEQEESMADLYDAGYITDANSEELTKRARELGVIRRDPIRATGVVTFSRSTTASQDWVVPSGTIVTTGGTDPVEFETTETATISSGSSSVDVNIRAVSAGPQGNVGSGTINVIVDSPPGVDSVNNTNPVGNTSYDLTDGTTPQSAGKNEETDANLRSRALDSTAIGGAGTAAAAELAIENIPRVVSADVYTNRADSTNNGVDPWHTEVRVYKGDIENIADRLYEVFPLGTLKTLQGGANGTLESTTLATGDLYGNLTIEITRPTETTLEIDIDVVHTGTYPGTNSVKDAITSYVGGEKTDQETVPGLGQEENVLVNEIENVAEDITGVDYADVTLLDATGNGSSDETTDSDGVPIYSVGASEVAIANASDISVTETAR